MFLNYCLGSKAYPKLHGHSGLFQIKAPTQASIQAWHQAKSLQDENTSNDLSFYIPQGKEMM